MFTYFGERLRCLCTFKIQCDSKIENRGHLRNALQLYTEFGRKNTNILAKKSLEPSRTITMAFPGCWAIGTNKVKKCMVRKKIF